MLPAMIQAKRMLLWFLLAVFCPGGAAAAWRQPDAAAWPNLFVWIDTCNVYVVREGEAALLIDLGDGSACDHLSEIGVKRVEWVLFTHHHREQCQGYAKLSRWKPKIDRKGTRLNSSH